MSYIALTMGPIIDTLMLGRKTSEIWMASYLFSSFMKKTIKELKNTTDAKFIVPYVDDEEIFNDKDDGVGMFHDRFILQSQTLSIKDVEKIIQNQKDNLSKMIASSIKADEQKVKKFFDSYLQTYLFQSEENFKNPILDISEILDSIELHTPTLEADEDYLKIFLNRDTILQSQLAKDSFGKKPSFDSIEVIASQEKEIENFQAKNAQKYIAIIHADGDSLGKYIKSQTDVSKVSKNLFSFGKKASQTIKEYGAIPLFIGGDDLLIFAPVLNNDKTVFDLVENLSKDYKNTLDTTVSTLSFGISITYYKYPLYEALQKSQKALFALAKSYQYENTKQKNAVAISAQKHSGQSFDFCIAKDEKAYEDFTSLINNVLTKNLELPHAIHHKLFKHQALFKGIPIKRVADTFENIFNEDIHNDKFKEGLQNIQKLMETLGTDEQAQDKLFSMLSTIKLIRGDR